MFPRLFRSKAEKLVDKMADVSRSNAKRQLDPLRKLMEWVLSATEKCRKGMDPWIVASNEKDLERMRAFARYEFAFFYLHMVMRYAFNVMTSEERTCLGKHLAKGVASVCVDATFEALPPDLRRRMISEFYTILQNAEAEYSRCAPCNIFAAPEDESGKAVAAMLAALSENVASAIQRQDDSKLKEQIRILACEQFDPQDLLRPIEEFKRNSMELADDY